MNVRPTNSAFARLAIALAATTACLPDETHPSGSQLLLTRQAERVLLLSQDTRGLAIAFTTPDPEGPGERSQHSLHLLRTTLGDQTSRTLPPSLLTHFDGQVSRLHDLLLAQNPNEFVLFDIKTGEERARIPDPKELHRLPTGFLVESRSDTVDTTHLIAGSRTGDLRQLGRSVTTRVTASGGYFLLRPEGELAYAPSLDAVPSTITGHTLYFAVGRDGHRYVTADNSGVHVSDIRDLAQAPRRIDGLSHTECRHPVALTASDEILCLGERSGATYIAFIDLDTAKAAPLPVMPMLLAVPAPILSPDETTLVLFDTEKTLAIARERPMVALPHPPFRLLFSPDSQYFVFMPRDHTGPLEIYDGHWRGLLARPVEPPFIAWNPRIAFQEASWLVYLLVTPTNSMHLFALGLSENALTPRHLAARCTKYDIVGARVIALANVRGQDRTGDLLVFDLKSGSAHTLASQVADFVVELSCEDCPVTPRVRLAYVVRARAPSAYDGLWLTELPP